MGSISAVKAVSGVDGTQSPIVANSVTAGKAEEQFADSFQAVLAQVTGTKKDTDVGQISVKSKTGNETKSRDAELTKSKDSDSVTKTDDSQKPETAQKTDETTETTAEDDDTMSATEDPTEPAEDVTEETSLTDGTETTDTVQENGTEEVEAGTEEIPEEVLEVVAQAAAEVITRIAEVLNVSQEEVVQALDSLGLEETDILDPDVLKQVVLEVSGNSDMMSLLTDEDLLADMRLLEDALNQTLGELETELELEPGELENLLQKLQNVTEQSAEETTEETVQVQEEEPSPVISSGKEKEQPLTETTRVSSARTFEPVTERSTTQSREQNAGTDGNGRQSENLILQNQEMQNVQVVQETSAGGVQGYTTVSTQEIANQILEFVKTNVSQETTSVEMQLTPESLGTLNIHLETRNGAVTAQFIAQNEAVKAVIENQAAELQQNLNAQGIKVEAVEVTLASHSFEENLNQGNMAGQEQNSEDTHRQKTHQINLADYEDISLEELDENEQLAVEMMLQNGNTVDYRA